MRGLKNMEQKYCRREYAKLDKRIMSQKYVYEKGAG